MAIEDQWHRGSGKERVRTALYGKGKRFRVRWRDDSGDRSKSFDLREQAKLFEADLDLRKASGAYIDPSAGKVTFKTYAEQWRSHQAHRPSTVSRTETILRLHVYPVLGDRPMSSIRPSDIRGWVKRLEHILAPSTVNNLHGIVAGIFLSAVDDRVIPHSPCVRQSGRAAGYLPEQTRDAVVPPTVEQVEAICASLPHRWRALAVLAASTGLRISEALALSIAPLEPHRVDLMRGQVHVNRSLALLNGKIRLGPTKTKAGRRRIPLPAYAKAALVEHLAHYPAATFELADDVERGQLRNIPLVFTGSRGAIVRRNWFATDIWHPAAVTAKAPDVRFHDLRHFYASLLIRHGESVKTVQTQLGHASAAETLDTYSHLWQDSEDRTLAAVDAVFGGYGVVDVSGDSRNG